MCLEKRKSGSWKRRASVNHLKEGKENEKGSEGQHNNSGIKRVCESKEAEEVVGYEVIGKKARRSDDNLQLLDMVEVASQNWPQMNQ